VLNVFADGWLTRMRRELWQLFNERNKRMRPLQNTLVCHLSPRTCALMSHDQRSNNPPRLGHFAIQPQN
jgi:hypothetical protein